MYHEIIKEISKELNIKYKILSNNWVISLEKDNKIKYITGYKFDLNNHASALVIDDKYAMYDTLKKANIPVIEHYLLYSEKNKEKYALGKNKKSQAIDYFNNHQKDIIIKGNHGTCGKEVYHITRKKDLYKTLNLLFKKEESLSLCPFYKIDSEYRVIVLNNKIELIYEKIRPIIYGDGVSKISTLLKEFNPSYNYLIKKDKVLKKDEKYTYTFKHNLSSGSIINTKIDNPKDITNLAMKVAKTLNISFGSIDIIKVDNKYYIMECNSGVMMSNLINLLPNGYTIAKNIYQKAIIAMFS